MKNTARTYSKPAGGDAPPLYEAASGRRPGSVKKQKQLRKAKDNLVAKQAELSTLVGNLEDRDTQQLAFTALLELLPKLDGTLVADLYTRVEKNKHPGRSSTRRMFVLALAAMTKCHPVTTARLLPRIMSYVAVRLRDKDVQITDACAILCSAIALYVVPYACVNGKGDLSPRKKHVSEVPDQAIDSATVSNANANDINFHTFESLVAHLSRETNAVGEHATKCIASIIRPTEFDGSTAPTSEVIGAHGMRIARFLHVLIQSLVSKTNESAQFACFSPTFLLFQAVLALAKTLKLDCANRDVYDCVLLHLSSLVDAIEDVFRDAPRDDWVVRKRGIELLILLIDLFVCGDTAEDNAGRRYFDENLERVRRLVAEARHDPVSAVRDAALPAVFLFDKLIKLFPRTGELPAPPSPFKRIYSGRGSGDVSPMKGFTNYRSGSTQSRRRESRQETAKKVVDNYEMTDKEGDQETTFTDSHGDESATPLEDGEPKTTIDDENPRVPLLRIARTDPLRSVPPVRRSATHQSKMTKTITTHQRIKIPSISVPKSPIHKEAVPFQPVAVDEDAFPEEHGDEQIADTIAPDGDPVEEPQAEKEAAVIHGDDNRPQDNIDFIRGGDNLPQDKIKIKPEMTRAEAAIVAAAQGETDVALRLSFLEDDMTLLRRVLTLTREPCAASLSHASRTALCAAFLEFLDPDQDARDEQDTDDKWLAFVWLKDLSRQPRFVQQLDPRVLRALEVRLNYIAEEPSRAGLVAADILSAMGL